MPMLHSRVESGRRATGIDGLHAFPAKGTFRVGKVLCLPSRQRSQQAAGLLAREGAPAMGALGKHRRVGNGCTISGYCQGVQCFSPRQCLRRVLQANSRQFRALGRGFSRTNRGAPSSNMRFKAEWNVGVFATLNFPIRRGNGIFGYYPGFAMEDGDQSRPTILLLREPRGGSRKACSFEQIDKLF